MNSRRNCIVAAIVAGGGLCLLLAAGIFYSLVIAPALLEKQRVAASPPSILVHAPAQGDSVSEGSLLSTKATATGRNPIARVELWWDGQLYDEQVPDSSEQDSLATYDARSAIEVTAGTHMLYWRAIDRDGLIGQSATIAVLGTPRLGGGETETVVAAEGQSLQDIAESMGSEPGVLADLNPDLGTEGLPAGTEVIVPSAGAGAVSQPVPPPNVPAVALPEPAPSSVVLFPAGPNLIDLGAVLPGFLRNLPAAPTNLQAGFEPCKVRLTWLDNAANEDAFHVWMQLVGGSPVMISTARARPGAGAVAYEFPAPRFGIYAVWVEAVNALGGQSSEIQGLFIDDDSCPQETASQLEIQVFSITTDGAWTNMYCYVSVEGAPGRRIPEDDSQFIQPGAVLGGTNLILVDMPADGELNLSGDCWGWPGPASMDFFATAVPSDQWDNRPLHTGGAGYDIEFRIRPFRSAPVEGRMSYMDLDLGVPTIVSVEPQTSSDPLERARLARNVTLKWNWQGDPPEIRGFLIAMDGTMDYRSVGETYRTTSITLPYSCGDSHKFAVAATGDGGVRSPYSSWYEFKLPPCEMYAQLDFFTFTIKSHDDSEPGSCDTAELVFNLSFTAATSTSFREWEDEDFHGYSADCGQAYHLTQFPVSPRFSEPGPPDSFIVMIDPDNSKVNMHMEFADKNPPFNDHDYICFYQRTFRIPYDEWDGYDTTVVEMCDEAAGGERYGTVLLNYRLRGFRTPSVP